MPRSSRAPSTLSVLRLLLLAGIPLACAVGVPPDTADEGGGDEGGSSSAGTLNVSGSVSMTMAGKGSNGGTTSGAFGGTASTAGKGGTSAAGAGGSGGAGGAAGAALSSHGGSGGAGGGTAGSGGAGGGAGAGTGGSGGGAGCACPKTLTWADNTVLSWSSGDCLDVAGTKYLYTGTKMQTYANAQCNPTKQEAWCTDSGNDYKFMACK